ncbi:MAG: adenylate/guanylate cyclase domain-containing protein [bacterium]|nr:adenylate/guanylate cyclase domain-containing protein [bacterium]
MMNNYTGVYDKCLSADEVHTQIQVLTKEFLQEIQFPFPSVFTPIDEGGAINLSILAELSHAELKHYQRPVFLSSEVCRLLIKAGDRKSLQLCLRLSHVIYTFKCNSNESNYISHLYKGISQIGLHLTDLGIKNVLYGMSMLLSPVDQALGYRALMSAAILDRNLRLALSFAEKWQQAARKGRLENDVMRAALVKHLLILVLGQSGIPSPEMRQLFSHPPSKWGDSIRFLQEWTDAVTSGKTPGEPRFIEPLPLLLGIGWNTKTADDQSERADEFALLCRTRRILCSPGSVAALSVDELQHYAGSLARWELPRPLYALETILKQKAADKKLESLMTRLLGKEMLESLVNKTSLDPDVLPQDEAIILVMNVRRFSQLSESRTPQEIFEILNSIFNILNNEMEQAGGTIHEFAGDRIIIVFNTFKRQRSEMSEILGHTIRSLQRIHVLNALSLQTERPEIQIGVGIHKGPVGLGYLGGLERCRFTVQGNAINLTAGIERTSKTLPGSVIVSERCFQQSEPDIWKNPHNINFSLRALGQHTMRNIKKRLRLFGANPLLRYWVDFVPMGFVAHPEEGVVYIDTGNSAEPGIIDHHFAGQQAQSACELLNTRPELLLDHIRNIPLSHIEFRLHNSPDFDCAATLYSAYELMGQEPRRDILRKLAAYVSRIDQGAIPGAEHLSDSLYGIFVAHQRRTTMAHGKEISDLYLLEAGLRAIDAAVYLMEQHPKNADFSSIFSMQQGWFVEEWKLIQEDLICYHEDLILRGRPYTASLKGRVEAVRGLWLDHPESLFYKLWARADKNVAGGKGYQFLTLDLSQPGKNRFLIQVDPESGTDLQGLGELLEQHESRKRKELGKERPMYPIRYPSGNSDPWYFGQGHAYTIVDSPRTGTVLMAEEVQKIHESWKGDL